MQRSDGTTILSPSDLVTFLSCEHATELDRRVLVGELARSRRDDADLELVREHGARHEARILERFRAAGATVAEVTVGHGVAALAAAEAETLASMRAGVDVVHQATFFDGRWRGHADFLLRTDHPSDLGTWSYDVADAKLARRVKPSAIVQLAAYAEQVERLQGAAPVDLVVITGDGVHHRVPAADAASHHRSLKARFEAVIDGGLDPTAAVPVEHCGVCDWAARCDAAWVAADDLCLIAGVRAEVAVHLRSAGIPTGAALAESHDGALIEGLATDRVDRLRRQARLQLAQRADGVVRHELLVPAPVTPAPPGPPGAPESAPPPLQGLALLPEPSPGDLFFDIEGDPWIGHHGIEYLFGLVETHGPGGGPPPFHAFWGHDPTGERAAFEAVVDLVIARLDADPGMHVYHFAPYERRVLEQLAGRYDTRLVEVDRILRGRVLVDLYQVVRHAVLVSQDGYGLKKLEPLYLPAAARAGEAVTDGGSSIVVYERWLETGDAQLLEDIRAYNELDCRSTLGLRDWLEQRRDELGGLTGVVLARPPTSDGAAPGGVAELDLAQAGAVAALRAGLPERPCDDGDDDAERRLLADLVGFHRREDRPEWSAYFQRFDKDAEGLVLDREAVGGLVHEATTEDGALDRYRFDPAQDHKLKEGSAVVDPATRRRAGTLVRLDPVAGTLELRRARGAPHPSALVPSGPVGTQPLQQALLALATYVVAGGPEPEAGVGPGGDSGGGCGSHGWSPWGAGRALLRRRPPSGDGPATPGLGGPVPLERPGEGGGPALVRLVHSLGDGCLAVQGPPGSGKTWHGAEAVVGLVAAGRRVAVTGPSHSVVGNLLGEVVRQAALAGVVLRPLQKCADGEGCGAAGVEATTSNDRVDAAVAAGEVDVVAGTAWLFARPELRGAFDVLVVDEAGQLSLATTLAASGTAQGLLLLGDPQQLAQPSKGSHPDGAGASGLEHVLAGAATIDPVAGLFLERSHRMHPEVCAFVSALSYDARLLPAPGCERRRVADGPVVGGAGLRWVPVDHHGNRTRSPEEAEAVAAVVRSLLGRPVTDEHGRTSTLTEIDILVIAPYNAQVATLADVLPDGVRVGTVDRFQGQQAPVVVYSLAASSADDVPRGIEFLLSTHRLNVAVSRAQALAVLVGSPALLAAPVRSPRQLRQVNALCRFVELATEVRLRPPSAAAPASGGGGLGPGPQVGHRVAESLVVPVES